MVRGDLVNPAYLFPGVVDVARSEGLYAFVGMTSSAAEQAGRVVFPGLNPAHIYSVEIIVPNGESMMDSEAYVQLGPPEWIASPVSASGNFLAEVGLPMPNVMPERAVLIHVKHEETSDD